MYGILDLSDCPYEEEEEVSEYSLDLLLLASAAARANASRDATPKYPVFGSPTSCCHFAISRAVFLSKTPVGWRPKACWSIPTSVPTSPNPRSRIGSHKVVTTSSYPSYEEEFRLLLS